ncbi:hypothetical protein IGI04_002700 [Brassica rapa subsp. trilocularis]|uniref:Uncharacterized protein n=1 Tax=Brassica rapa subsp. trilocularis TaxID=1813537 RepID=A0ABQ7NWA7_BRACM|nr:hypothetical protein IGI04_002700 [Brassica rapa subsp. trilocularis]
MKQVMAGMVTQAPLKSLIEALLLISISFLPLSSAYRPGDIVAMSKMGQYHSSRTTWHDVIGKHCPIFAVNREVLIPIAKPVGYTGTDPYKIKFQVGSEKFLIHWLLVINRKSSEVPMIDVNLRYSGGDLLGVTAQVVDMPLSYLNTHPEIRKQFWDPQHWPKHILDTVVSRYLAKTLYCDACRKEQSEIDVSSGFYVLFGSALTFSFVLSIYVLQSSREKLARFVRETVVESSSNVGEFGKVE